MSTPPVRYHLDPATGAFTIEGYNWARPLSDFFPGIAGRFGVPLWAYLVNRGQAIASVGVGDKDGQILEFQSFNQACMRIAREGFRTFLRLDGGPVYEPFAKTADPQVQQSLRIGIADLGLVERNEALGLEVEVAYFPLPGLPLAALGRSVWIRDLSGKDRRLEWLDGAARVIPYGMDQARIKGIPRHIEAMMGVASHAGVPLFRLKQTPDDSEKVGQLTGGHFYLSPGATLHDGLLVDPEALFGEPFHYDVPWVFADGGLTAVRDAYRFSDNKTPCAFTLRDDTLAAGGEVRLDSLLGYVPRDEDIDQLIEWLSDPGFLEAKRQENVDTVSEVADACFTLSGSPEYDAYARQNFLDNTMRGGLPLPVDTIEGRRAFHVYSRQNGDLERDYHFFVLEPGYLSQGTGHYRSVLQNRRTDGWFFPEIEAANLVRFLDLIQLDGYNPLEVNELAYRIADDTKASAWLEGVVPEATVREDLHAQMRASYTPGALARVLERDAGVPREDLQTRVAEAISWSRENEVGGLHEGFWVDHWHYNVDTLDIFRMIWPERMHELLIGDRSYRWFDDPDVVRPRNERIVLTERGPRAFDAVARDAEKAERIEGRDEDAWAVRTEDGRILRASLLEKLLNLVTTRLATLDAANVGVEMEAGKPGWNDSMNGLPSLLGSGLSETAELYRTLRLLEELLPALGLADTETVPVCEELAGFVDVLAQAVRRRLDSEADDAAFEYWDVSNTLKEAYRDETRHGVSGEDRAVSLERLRGFVRDGRLLLDEVFEGPLRSRAMSPEGVPYTYFVNTVAEHEPLGQSSASGLPLVRPVAFSQRPVKLFLEGPVHWMKARPEDAAEVHDAVKRSPIYDRKLRMFKSCEPLAGETPELGRAVGAYPRGWCEHESIYLHMEYKYLLELIRAGLCDEFWEAARDALVAFQDPDRYGRSPLQGASFIVSSAYGDARVHGQAFQPRLSGVTVEFVHMWLLAVAGEAPFSLDADGALELRLAPRLPGWLFTEAPASRRYHDPEDGWSELDVGAGAFAFKLCNRALVVYDNPERLNTWGDEGAHVAGYRLAYRDGRTLDVEGPAVRTAHATAVREGKVRRIDARLTR